MSESVQFHGPPRQVNKHIPCLLCTPAPHKAPRGHQGLLVNHCQLVWLPELSGGAVASFSLPAGPPGKQNAPSPLVSFSWASLLLSRILFSMKPHEGSYTIGGFPDHNPHPAPSHCTDSTVNTQGLHSARSGVVWSCVNPKGKSFFRFFWYFQKSQ